MMLAIAKTWWALRCFAYMFRCMVQFQIVRLFSKERAEAAVLRQFKAFPEVVLGTMNYDLIRENQDIMDNVDWSRDVFLIANHQSYIDIPVVMYTAHRRIGFIAKKELARIPFLAFWMRQFHCIFIKRERRGAAGQIIAELKRRPFASHIVVFPEGTRSKDRKIAKFKSGVFRLAYDADGILLPMYITGTRDGWEDRKRVGEKAIAHCRVMEPIDFKKVKEEGRSAKDVQKQMQALYEEIHAGASEH